MEKFLKKQNTFFLFGDNRLVDKFLEYHVTSSAYL